MCYEYERLEQLRREMEREMQRNKELKKQGKTQAPASPARPEKEVDRPVPA